MRILRFSFDTSANLRVPPVLLAKNFAKREKMLIVYIVFIIHLPHPMELVITPFDINVT